MNGGNNMIEITLEELAKDIDKYFDIASQGQLVKAKTENDGIVILSEDEYNNLKNQCKC